MTLADYPTVYEPDPETVYRLLADIHDFVRDYPDGDYPWPEAPADLDPLTVDGWLLEAERASKVATILRQRIEALILSDIRRRGEIRLRDMLYKAGRDTTIRWAHDDAADALVSWVIRDAKTPEEAALRIAKVVRIDVRAVRLGGLEALASLRALRDNPKATEQEIAEAYRAAFDTFLARVDSDGAPKYVLSKVPMRRAPKWAQSLGHGERRERKDHHDG
jgi:hypothetical protein